MRATPAVEVLESTGESITGESITGESIEVRLRPQVLVKGDVESGWRGGGGGSSVMGEDVVRRNGEEW